MKSDAEKPRGLRWKREREEQIKIKKERTLICKAQKVTLKQEEF